MPATDIINWLLSTGRTYPTVPRLQVALAEKLVGHAPIDRLWCGTTVFHPQAAAYFWIWQRNSPSKEHELGYARFAQLDKSDNPMRRLKHGASHVRFRHPEGEELPDVADLWRAGFRDLYGQSMLFRGAWVGGITWATRAEGGFTSVQLEFLEQLTRALTAVIEPLARDLVTATLLRQTSLGPGKAGGGVGGSVPADPEECMV